MARTRVSREQAQSFDQVAWDYDRLGELNGRDHVGRWLEHVVLPGGRRALDLGCGSGKHAILLAARFEHVDAVDLAAPMIAVARARRQLANISYRQADLHDVDGAAQYDLVLSVMTLHHVPDLHAALARIRRLVAPGGRLVIVDVYDIDQEPGRRSPAQTMHQLIGVHIPLRVRLQVLAALRFGAGLVRDKPAVAWERYRLSTRPAWLDHLVSDRFFSRRELERCCAEEFAGYRFDVLGGPRGIGLVWDAPLVPAASAGIGLDTSSGG